MTPCTTNQPWSRAHAHARSQRMFSTGSQCRIYLCPRRQHEAVAQLQHKMVTIEQTFLPFIRTDRYGEGGWAPQHFVEKARLVMLALTLLPCRFLSCLSVVASYYLIVRITSVLPIPELWKRRLISFLGKLWSRLCLFALGFVSIRWIRVGAGNSRGVKRRSVAVVSNHMGWADILIQMARYFPAFVARDGTQNLPMIGFVSQRMQCLYVDREKKNNNSSDNNNNGPAPGVAADETQTAAAKSVLTSAASAGQISGNPEAPVIPASTTAAGGGGGGGISSAVKQRMLLTAQHPELELRPMLLFPEGTTSNGHYLLPFKTGAFLAGVPVLPTIIHYSSSSGASSKTARALALITMTAAALAAAALAVSKGAGGVAAAAAGVCAAGAVCVLSLGSVDGCGGVSPCWESIDARRHLLLMMCQPFHTVRCYELPLYEPSDAEKADPKLYAANVRQYMLKHSADVAAAAARAAARRHNSSSSSSVGVSALLPSDGLLSDKRRYQDWLRSRRKEVEAGHGITADMFQQQQQQQQHQQQQQEGGVLKKQQ